LSGRNLPICFLGNRLLFAIKADFESILWKKGIKNCPFVMRVSMLEFQLARVRTPSRLDNLKNVHNLEMNGNRKEVDSMKRYYAVAIAILIAVYALSVGFAFGQAGGGMGGAGGGMMGGGWGWGMNYGWFFIIIIAILVILGIVYMMKRR